jgi:hypothetical protein
MGGGALIWLIQNNTIPVRVIEVEFLAVTAVMDPVEDGVVEGGEVGDRAGQGWDIEAEAETGMGIGGDGGDFGRLGGIEDDRAVRSPELRIALWLQHLRGKLE